jgi:predicted lipid-binding transport protein (Tim44 family)
MKRTALVVITLLAFGIVTLDAEARRMGGARSLGQQRDAISQRQTPPRAPAQQQPQQQSTPAQQQQAAPATAPAQQPAAGSRWLGPLAGLALGAGLAALFLNNGIAGVLAGLLLMLAIAAGVFFLVRMLRSRMQPDAGMQYAGATPGRSPDMEPVYRAGTGAAPHSVAATTSGAPAAGTVPAGFDAAQFLRHAKLNFVRLQSANDAGDLSTIRDFLTPELYREIEAEVRERGGMTQKTDVVTLDAEVLDVATEGGEYVVSVRFTGLLRETPEVEPQPFSEVWHLQKPLRGGTGWLLAGIQQG